MRRTEASALHRQVRARTRDLRRKILAYDLISMGTLHSRTKVCGQPSCRCHDDPKARHGPYYEWTRYEAGKLLHRVVTAEQARLLDQAIANWRAVEWLLAHWQRQTVEAILGLRSAK
jgi:hypothetical protein